jgi:hypothetical protein
MKDKRQKDTRHLIEDKGYISKDTEEISEMSPETCTPVFSGNV